MRKKIIVSAGVLCVLTASCLGLWGQNAPESIQAGFTELVRYGKEFSSAHIAPAAMSGRPGIAVIFDGTSDMHYYASRQTAPGGYNLKVEAKSEDFTFDEPVFPKWNNFHDKQQRQNTEVYVGRFTIFVPIKEAKANLDKGSVSVKISGVACTSTICLTPFEKMLQGDVDWSQKDSWKQISFEIAASLAGTIKGPSYPLWFALGLAFLAGLSLNIMPCVWPVLPLIVMRIVEQAKQSRRTSVLMGFAFCAGILLFFACLAAANIILQVSFSTVLQWGDQFRNPDFVAGMSLLLVVLALFMFGIFSISIPSGIAGKTGSGKGYAGALGMGFLAAILSTPCSFAILAAAFAWAQTQPLPLASIAMMVIGLGMALPYAVLTSMPDLLKRLPRSGQWMELFKQAMGFVLLVIAVKLIAALPEARRMGVLYFAVTLAFCVWMWGGWVGYGSKLSHKLIVRIIAVIVAVAAGLLFLTAPAAQIIDWQKYDSNLIETAKADNRPVLIKFTADWCLSCQVVEKTVYRRGDIAKLIKEKNVLAIKGDTTVSDYPATIALKNVYNEPGVPVSILFVPGQKEPVIWRGLAFTGELKTTLEKLPSK